MEWIKCNDGLPCKNGDYLVTTKDKRIKILGFHTELYKLDKYDFYKYKNKKIAGFYNYDGEWGYTESDNVLAWMELPKCFTE